MNEQKNFKQKRRRQNELELAIRTRKAEAGQGNPAEIAADLAEQRKWRA